jgi:hypothetical protein
VVRRTQFARPALRPRPAAPGAALAALRREPAPYKVWPPEKLAELGRPAGGRAASSHFWCTAPARRRPPGRSPARMAPARWWTPAAGLPVLKGILARCALFVGNDGGPKHLAALSGMPSVAVYGHVHPEAWTRPGDPRQRWVATASRTRRQPTSGPCESGGAAGGPGRGRRLEPQILALARLGGWIPADRMPVHERHAPRAAPERGDSVLQPRGHASSRRRWTRPWPRP